MVKHALQQQIVPTNALIWGLWFQDSELSYNALDDSFMNFHIIPQTIALRGAWNSQENATDFPRCDFCASHDDITEQQFFCKMRATHEKDSAGNEIVAFFQQVNKLIIIFTLFMLYLHCYRNAIDFTKQFTKKKPK